MTNAIAVSMQANTIGKISEKPRRPFFGNPIEPEAIRKAGSAEHFKSMIRRATSNSNPEELERRIAELDSAIVTGGAGAAKEAQKAMRAIKKSEFSVPSLKVNENISRPRGAPASEQSMAAWSRIVETVSRRKAQQDSVEFAFSAAKIHLSQAMAGKSIEIADFEIAMQGIARASKEMGDERSKNKFRVVEEIRRPIVQSFAEMAKVEKRVDWTPEQQKIYDVIQRIVDSM